MTTGPGGTKTLVNNELLHVFFFSTKWSSWHGKEAFISETAIPASTSGFFVKGIHFSLKCVTENRKSEGSSAPGSRVS